MNPVPDDDLGFLPPSAVEHVDQVCDRFEAAWMQGNPPRIEDFLGGVDGAIRPALLRELIALELAWRRRHGEQPRPEDYHRQFPADAGPVDRAFQEEGGRRSRSAQPSPAIRSGPVNTGDNLLFGILALQNNFIDRTALLAAFNAWVADKARPLGRILVELGLLDGARHDLLCALVSEHLKLHDNDPDKSLAAVNLISSVRKDLEDLADPDLSVSLGHVSFFTNATAADRDVTLSWVAISTAAGGRFRILRPHARGGLGEVFVAHDEELHREVALKEIQPQHADDPHSRSRFVQEAEITGGLEHPGIVPVYSLGHYDNGRPYYAMRFVKGNTLKEATKQFHEADKTSKRDAGERSLALRRLLDRFLDVCNAVAYAHSRGVLHRDLKPGNVLLGPYGETLVVDWGLAKVVGRKETGTTGTEPTLRPPSGSGVESTLSHSALGTPGYMSPEQAAGDLDNLGPRSEVYSLGATLYYLLTNRSPFPDAEIAEVLAKTRRGDFPPVRSIKHDVPRALEAICLKAMALKAEDRYASPRELAEDIEHWVADERVQAYGEPFSARSGRWIRKNLVLFTNAVLLLICSIVFIWIIQYARLRSEEQRRASENFRLAFSGFDKMSDAARRSIKALEQPELKSRLASKKNLESEIRNIINQYSEGFAIVNNTNSNRSDIHMTIELFRPRPGAPNEPLVEDPLGTVSEKPDRLILENDSVQIHATLSAPGYAYLIALHPNGDFQRYYPDSDDTPPPLASLIVSPAQTDDAKYQVTCPLTDGTGLQAFVLIVSDRPLPPYRDWIKGLGMALHWQPSGSDAEGVWQFDGRLFRRLDPLPPMTPSDARRSSTTAPPTFANTCKFLAGRPEVKTIQAWAFPVRPTR